MGGIVFEMDLRRVVVTEEVGVLGGEVVVASDPVWGDNIRFIKSEVLVSVFCLFGVVTGAFLLRVDGVE